MHRGIQDAEVFSLQYLENMFLKILVVKIFVAKVLTDLSIVLLPFLAVVDCDGAVADVQGVEDLESDFLFR